MAKLLLSVAMNALTVPPLQRDLGAVLGPYAQSTPIQDTVAQVHALLALRMRLLLAE